MGWRSLWEQMVRVGVRSVPIVVLVLFCIGAILALQISPILKDYGAVARTGDIISIAVFRELGPLVAGVVLTGFAGASIAAELGTMVVSEEIEALEAEAISPVRFLVLPRVLATIAMMVCVSVIANLSCVWGGLVVSRYVLGISPRQYLNHTFAAIKVRDFITGLIKAGVFGGLISSFACYLGLNVTGGPGRRGRHHPNRRPHHRRGDHRRSDVYLHLLYVETMICNWSLVTGHLHRAHPRAYQ